MAATLPLLGLTQGDPAGIGPEILLKVAAQSAGAGLWRPLLIAERSALEVAESAAGAPPARLAYITRSDLAAGLPAVERGVVPVIDPIGCARDVSPGRSTRDDARGALAALDLGSAAARAGQIDALVTGPLSKVSIARHLQPDFRGHTDYLARACGLELYGRDYLMTFLAADLKVALLTTHLPLSQALARVATEGLLEALLCLGRHVSGRIAVAGLNPHAGEGGLMGNEERERIAPAVAEARRRGLDVAGPESPDTVFMRARQGEFDWVMALYHDQGLIAVKTVAFGAATNWTLGLPFVRTSVDHGTAFEIAGRGVADATPLARAAQTAVELLRSVARAGEPGS